MEEKKKTSVFNICTYVLGIIAIVFTIYTMYSIKKFNLFNFQNISNYIYIAGIIIILLLTICIFKFKKTAIVLSILTIILNSGFFYGIQSITGLFEKFSQNAKYEEIKVNIYTLKENEKKDISSIISELEKDKDFEQGVSQLQSVIDDQDNEFEQGISQLQSDMTGTPLL